MSDGRTAGPALRWLRALALSAAAMATGASFHAAAAGSLPAPTVLLLLLALSTAAAAPFLGRPASTLRVTVLLVLWQTTIHGVLTALAEHRAARPDGLAPLVSGHAASHTMGAGSVHEPMPTNLVDAPTGPVAPDVLAHLTDGLTASHALMALAHLAAAVVVGLWLAAGERAVWSLLALATGSVVTVISTLLAMARPALTSAATQLTVPSAPVPTGAARPLLLFLVRGVPRRGPPLPV